MSDISTLYDTIISKTELLFPLKQRLHNPYELMDNPELISKDSWGLKVGSAERINQEFCSLSVGRDFTFVLIRQFASIGSRDDAFDITTKYILEDQQSFLDMIYSPNELGIESTIDQVEINSISGIEFTKTNEKKYLFAEITFRIILSKATI